MKSLKFECEKFTLYKIKRSYLKGLLKLELTDEWDHTRKDKLIESIFLNIPIPSIYAYLEKDGVITILDGNNRLKCLIDFLENNYVVENVSSITYLKGKKISDLTPKDVSNFEDYVLRFNILNSLESDFLKKELRSRLNI